MMPAYYLMVVAVIGLITGVTMKETANRPLKGATTGGVRYTGSEGNSRRALR